MTTKEIEEILNSYSWIKVKRFDPNPRKITFIDPGDQYKESYRELEKHHKEETEFLIKKCRELAQVVKDYKGWED
jgi:predicted Rossmann-fold nucleotide-binding protein